MGQKVNPHGFRVGVIKNWDSRWFARDEVFGDILVSDYKVRTYLKEKLFAAGVPEIEIERDGSGNLRVFIHCAKPGVVIGRGGEEIEKLRVELEKMTGKSVSVNVVEVKPVDMCAQLVAESIASQLERRIGFRRAMKQAIGRTMRLGAKGIKISVGGRLGGAEIARTEHYHEGTIPLQTIRADIDYGFWEARTTYGRIGVKVWIYKGEILPEVNRPAGRSALDHRAPKPPRDRRDDRRSDRRPYGDRKPYGDRAGGRPGQGGGRQGGRPGGNRGFGGHNQNESAPQYGNGNRPQGYTRPAPKPAPAATAPAAEAAPADNGENA
jgi:small subunit ribosomal protein S3